MAEPLIVVGNGMAAAKLAEELAACALGRYAVAVIGEEPHLAYNRVLLSSVLAKESSLETIALKTASWWRDRGVTLRYGCAAQSVDLSARTLTLADGKILAFSKLVFATGSRPIRLPLPGADLPGVVTFRDIADVSTMNEVARPGARVAVIGGGLLGLEAAYGLNKSGAKVSLVHLMDCLMERQLDARAGAMLKRAVEALGIRVLTSSETDRIEGETKVEALVLKDGRKIATDAVVFAVGIAPNVALARDAGLRTGRGILVDDGLESSAPGVYAIGECVEHRGRCYGLVEPVYEQACVLARRLAGERASYEGSVLATNLKVSGVNVFSAGNFLGGVGTEDIVFSDPGFGAYKKLVLRDDRLTGAVLYGDTADGLWYLDLIRSGTPVDAMRGDLIFGRSFAIREAA
jgi:nitrite reductase [NAD(P)H] large subunit